MSAMHTSELRRRIEQALPTCLMVDAGSVAGLQGRRGAYALALHVPIPVRFARTGIAATDLSGWFVYAGSAQGAGGLPARLGRHFRRDKPVRWHIDELSNACDRSMAFVMADGGECDIVARLLRTGGFETALPGFGSSDCHCCAAHLLRPAARGLSL